MQSIALIAFTEQGCRMARRIADGLAACGTASADAIAVSGPARFAETEGVNAYKSLSAWTKDAFAGADALVFVGATGIAVRAIAPHVVDKFTDPAVVCIDELGRIAVPLLSGHVGQANDLARTVASITDGIAAVSTATDINGLFAVDSWARANNLAIIERVIAKEVSAALLSGETVGVSSSAVLEGALPQGLVRAEEGQLGVRIGIEAGQQPFARTLHLVPRAAYVGVGCKRGIDPAWLKQVVDEALAEAKILPYAVAAIASIDVKSDEPAVLELASALNCEACFFTADELNAVPGEFEDSEFVRARVGVGNVCERAALAAAGAGGKLIMPKRPADGTTVAIAIRPAGPYCMVE